MKYRIRQVDNLFLPEFKPWWGLRWKQCTVGGYEFVYAAFNDLESAHLFISKYNIIHDANLPSDNTGWE